MSTTDAPAGERTFKPVPAGYHTASPYLIARNAATALDFYKRAFGAIETRRLSTPDGKIMHAEIKIGDSIVMVSDEFPSHQALSPEHFGGSPAFIVLYVANVDALFAQAVAAGAKILRPLEDQFFGDRSGTLLDPFGHRWNLSSHIEDVSEEEIARRFSEMMKSAGIAASSGKDASTNVSPRADTSIRRSVWILAAIALLEGGWVLMNLRVNGWRFLGYLGFAPGRAGHLAGWIAAAIVVAVFVRLSLRFPSVRAHLFRPSWLKLLALLVAITSGILEEVMFRRWPMNYLHEHGYGPVLQVLGAGLLFGLLHGVWGFMGGSLRAAWGATLATGFLGVMLAIVFLAAGRSLAPCVVAHFLINALIEPGLVLAATRGEMSRAA